MFKKIKKFLRKLKINLSNKKTNFDDFGCLNLTNLKK